MATYTYLRVQADVSDGLLGDELTFRKAIQDALARSFGLTAAGTHVDVLRLRSGRTAGTKKTALNDDSDSAQLRVVDDAVIRVARDDAQRVKAAIASAPKRMSIVDEAHFLPALLASESSPAS